MNKNNMISIILIFIMSGCTNNSPNQPKQEIKNTTVQTNKQVPQTKIEIYTDAQNVTHVPVEKQIIIVQPSAQPKPVIKCSPCPDELITPNNTE